MKKLHLLSGFLLSLVVSTAGIQPVSAELPSLGEQPWLGYFAVFANTRYEFTVASADGVMRISPMNDKRVAVATTSSIPVQLVVEELMPDGKITVRKLDAASLQTVQPATEKLTKAVITGKVGGGATVEFTLEQTRGTIFMGGRITDPGTLKNTLRIAVYATSPSLYPARAGAKVPSKKEEQAREKKLSSDHLTLKGIDGKRRKASFEKRVDASSAEITGSGLAAAEIASSVYGNKKIQFTASSDSAMTIKNDQGGPLHEGFVIRWSADPAKDPQGKARLAFEVK